MTRAVRCPRCNARCVVETREEALCLACGHDVRPAVNPLSSSSVWTASLPSTSATDRGRHFFHDDEERFAR